MGALKANLTPLIIHYRGRSTKRLARHTPFCSKGKEERGGDGAFPLRYQLQALSLTWTLGQEPVGGSTFPASLQGFSGRPPSDAPSPLDVGPALPAPPALQATVPRCDTLPSPAFSREPGELLKRCDKSSLLAKWLILQHWEGISDLPSARCLARRALGCWWAFMVPLFCISSSKTRPAFYSCCLYI